jgi:hypothetical protein
MRTAVHLEKPICGSEIYSLQDLPSRTTAARGRVRTRVLGYIPGVGVKGLHIDNQREFVQLNDR